MNLEHYYLCFVTGLSLVLWRDALLERDQINSIAWGAVGFGGMAVMLIQAMLAP